MLIRKIKNPPYLCVSCCYRQNAHDYMVCDLLKYIKHYMVCDLLC